MKCGTENTNQSVTGSWCSDYEELWMLASALGCKQHMYFSWLLGSSPSAAAHATWAGKLWYCFPQSDAVCICRAQTAV